MNSARSVRPVVPVLVVDDGVATRSRICALIGELDGVEVVGCPAVRNEVLHWLTELDPDCVVIDVPVRSSDGYALLAEVRTCSDTCNIVVLTDHAVTEFWRRSLDAGANHFLVKSLEFERVVDLVRALQEIG